MPDGTSSHRSSAADATPRRVVIGSSGSFRPPGPPPRCAGALAVKADKTCGPATEVAAYLLLVSALIAAPPAVAQNRTPAATPSPASEGSVQDLAARVRALERHLGASALLDLVTRLDRLAKEIQQLRDHIEVQGHEIEALKGRQRDLYAELDRLSRRIAVPQAVGSASPGRESAPGPGTGQTAAGTGSSAARESSTAEVRTGGAATDERADAATTGGSSGPSGGQASPYDPVEEQSRYQLAFDLLSEGSFERAAGAFAEFQAAFPDSRYRDNARFWQGECLYALRKFEPALGQFRGLVENHPDSPRVPGAKLKIGFILHELGRTAEAAEVLRVLVETAPDSSEAKLARDRLARLP